MAKKNKPAKWIEAVKGSSGQWHWRIVSRNGKIDSTSETYASKGNCTRAMKRLSAKLGIPIL